MQGKRHDRVVEMRLCFFSGKVGDYKVPFKSTRKCRSTVGAVLERAQNLAKWVKKLERYALEELVKGNDIPGWKIVEGRSNREFTDIDKAYEALIDAGYKKELLYDQVPVPLTKAEKQISKEDYNNVLAQFIIKPKGRPTLALESDKRPAYERKPSAEEAFGGENAYKEEQK